MQNENNSQDNHSDGPIENTLPFQVVDQSNETAAEWCVAHQLSVAVQCLNAIRNEGDYIGPIAEIVGKCVSKFALEDGLSVLERAYEINLARRDGSGH